MLEILQLFIVRGLLRIVIGLSTAWGLTIGLSSPEADPIQLVEEEDIDPHTVRESFSGQLVCFHCTEVITDDDLFLLCRALDLPLHRVCALEMGVDLLNEIRDHLIEDRVKITLTDDDR